MKKQLLAAALLAFIATPSMASDLYLLAELGQGKLDVDAEDYSASRTETAYSIGGGYKFNDTLALEIAYRNLGSFDESEDLDLGGGTSYSSSSDTTVHVLQASLVAQLPLNDSAAFYGRLGVGSLKVKSDYEVVTTVEGEGSSSDSGSESDSSTKAVFGIGFKYALNQAVALRAEYNQYAEWDAATLSSVVLGLTYQF